MTEQFSCYSRLERSSRDIRLLILSPIRHADHRLQGSLVVKSLDSSPKYEALSYTWGLPDDFNFKIWVNGVQVSVRQNLLCALRVLQGESDRVLWIDALCINQCDDVEKGHQVEMMRDIYRNSSKVLSWLGAQDVRELTNLYLDTETARPEDTPLLAFEFLASACRESLAAEAIGQPWPKQFRSKISGKGTRLSKQQWEWDYLQNVSHERHRSEVTEICNLSYWTRIWIVQEICLAPQVDLLYGTKSVDWEILSDFFTSIEWLASSIPFVKVLGRSRAKTIQKIAHPTFTYKDKFKEIIEMTTKSSCQDSRDKIYATLGLQSEAVRKGVAVNYSTSLFDLFCRVMKFWVREQGDPSCSEIAKFSNILQKSLLSPSSDAKGFQEMLQGRVQPSLPGGINTEMLEIKVYYVDVCHNISYSIADMIDQFTTSECTARVGGLHEEPVFGPSDSDTYKNFWSQAIKMSWDLDQDKMVSFSEHPSPFIQTKTKLKESSRGLSIFVTISGITGLAPKGIQTGDEVWRLDVSGSQSSWLIVRRTPSTQVIGRALVTHDICRSLPVDNLLVPLRRPVKYVTKAWGRRADRLRLEERRHLITETVNENAQFIGMPKLFTSESPDATQSKNLEMQGRLSSRAKPIPSISTKDATPRVVIPLPNFSKSQSYAFNRQETFQVSMPVFQVLTCPLRYLGIKTKDVADPPSVFAPSRISNPNSIAYFAQVPSELPDNQESFMSWIRSRVGLGM